jgi:hypothetical protein
VQKKLCVSMMTNLGIDENDFYGISVGRLVLTIRGTWKLGCVESALRPNTAFD